MKVCVDGIYRDASAEEEAELCKNKLLYEKMQSEAPELELTPEERLAELENITDDIILLMADIIGG